MEKEKKIILPGTTLDEETAGKIRQALVTVDISSLAHISEVRKWNVTKFLTYIMINIIILVSYHYIQKILIYEEIYA